MTHVPRAVFDEAARVIRAKAAARKTKRLEKRAALPWAQRVKKAASGSLFKWWAARCDALWGKAIRARDILLYGDVCRIQKANGCTRRAECGYHLLSKARGQAIRWHLKAGVAACAPCNDGERLNRQLYAEYHEELFGRDFMDGLRTLARTKMDYDVPGLKSLAADFQKVIEENTRWI